MKYKSNYTKDELIKRWDDITGPARFAGADDEHDWIYISQRNEDKIKLVKKPKGAYDPYAAVFRGKIVSDGQGSAITGIFTKGIADYIITAAVFAIYFGVCISYYARSDDKTVPAAFMIAGVCAVILLLTVFPGKRKKYGELIKKVTEGEPGDVSYNGTTEEKSGSNGAEPENKYKFRMK